MSQLEVLNKNQQAVKKCRVFFNDKWTLYQKVLANNYMKHQDIYQVLHSFFQANLPKNFSLLDLGCGDASFMAKALHNTKISYYLGIDMSEIAIAIAQENLQLISCDQKFIQEDFTKVIPLLAKQEANQFDVIVTSFSFHHLKLTQKDYIFNLLKQLLKPGGKFVLIDFVVPENETTEAYIQRYLSNVKQHWHNLTSEEIKLVCHHMLESDYPETQTMLESLAIKNGFQQIEELYQEKNISKLSCFSC